MAGNAKQLYKRYITEQGVTPHDLQALSPPQTSMGVSPGQYRYLYRLTYITNNNVY